MFGSPARARGANASAAAAVKSCCCRRKLPVAPIRRDQARLRFRAADGLLALRRLPGSSSHSGSFRQTSIAAMGLT